MSLRRTLGLGLISLSAAYSHAGNAQTLVSTKVAFSGRNIYAPTMIYDDQEKLYKMWYGGWQADSDYPNDKIYLRTSSDGQNWGSPVTVLTPPQMPNPTEHVNDPTVTKHFNAAANAYQYTMFFVACKKPCTAPTDNEIWSTVSGDGKSWGSISPVLQGGGASTPSAVIDQASGGQFWSVYYSNTAEDGNHPTRVIRASVNGNRQALSVETVYQWKADAGALANPEVRYVGGNWDLFFNIYHRQSGATHDTADIFLVSSTSNRSWANGSEKGLIVNNPSGSFCLAIAPGALPLNTTGRFIIDFGQSPADGTCNPANLTSIQQYTFQQ